MATCKYCLHYEACKENFINCDGNCDKEESCGCFYGNCDCFKDKSEWVHLPCKYGDKIFMIVGDIEAGTAFVDEGKVISVTYEHTGVWIYARYGCGLSCHHKFGCGDCFFTIEEAEKELEKKKCLEVLCKTES